MNQRNKEPINRFHHSNMECTGRERLFRPFIRLWVGVRESFSNLYHRCQRFGKGYSNRDLWEMRDWFIQTAKPMLREMSAKAENFPEEVGETRWRAILLEMAELLEVMDLWEDTAARKSAGVAENDQSNKAIRQIYAQQEQAKNRFFFLFNKYFYDLWY